MKYYKKIALAAMCLVTAFSAVMPAFYAVADNEENTVSYDDEVMPISIEDGEAVAIDEDGETQEDPAETDVVSDEDQVFVVGDFRYKVDSEGNAIIIGCTSSETEITIPEKLNDATVTEISARAFLEKNFTKVHIPATITYISAENPFASLLFLTEITVDENNENYTAVDGILYSKDKKTLLCYPPAKAGTSFAIPDGVEELGIAAISGTELKEIKLPSSLTKLNRHCFSYNESLTSIDMSGNDFYEVPVMAFANCTALTDVKFSDSTVSIELACFMDCTALADIELPPMIAHVGQAAFQGTALTKIIIPATVSEIGFNAFGYVDDYKTVENFVIIGAAASAASAYANDTDSENNVANKFTFMTLEAYEKQLEYESLDAVTVGDFTYAVIDGEGCLVSCTSISDIINVPSEFNGVTLTSVYYGAFQSCGSTNIVLPETIKKIGENAFSYLVQEITIPGGCTEIEGDEPFISCTSLKSITVTEGDGEFSSENGILYNKDKTKLIAYPQSKEDESFTAPKSLKEIAKSGLCYNMNLKQVDISSVEIIGDYAFEGCMNLENAKLSKKLNFVGVNAFLGCEAMKSVRLYNNVETIGDYAFGYTYDAELAELVPEDGSEAVPYSVMDGFVIYADEDSLGYGYARLNNIEVITDTVLLGTANVQKSFIYIMGGLLLAVLLAIIGVFTGKNIKKKKQDKASSERKAKSAEKKASAENDEKATDDTETENSDTEDDSDED